MLNGQRFSTCVQQSHHPMFLSLWPMDRTVSCKCSLTPSQFPLSSCFAGCCLPAAETNFHPAASMANEWPEGPGIHRLPKSSLGKGKAALPDHKAQTAAHSTLGYSKHKERDGTGCGNTTLSRAWATPAASASHAQQSSGPPSSSPAPAAEHGF